VRQKCLAKLQRIIPMVKPLAVLVAVFVFIPCTALPQHNPVDRKQRMKSAGDGRSSIGNSDLQPVSDRIVENKTYGPSAETDAVQRTRLLYEKSMRLLRAAKQGSIAGIRDNLNPLTIDRKGGIGKTPLIVAAENGHVKAVRLLLERGADVSLQDNRGKTALMAAAINRHPEVMRLLKEHGAKVTLIVAVILGDETQARRLIQEGADVNAKTLDGLTPLMAASRTPCVSMVELLLENGANERAKSRLGFTALMAAAAGGHSAIVKLLLAKGANAKAQDELGRTVLIHAATGGSVDVVRLLLNNGARVDAPNISEGSRGHGWTALMHASMGGHLDVVRLLLDEGARVNAKTPQDGTALMAGSMGGDVDVVRLLLKRGATIDAVDNSGKTALTAAVSRGRIDVVKLLIQKGADPNATDKYGYTVLMRAAGTRNADLVSMICELGTDPNLRRVTDRRTALMVAASRGDLNVVRVLLEKGAHVDAIDVRPSKQRGYSDLITVHWNKREGVYENVIRRFDGEDYSASYVRRYASYGDIDITSTWAFPYPNNDLNYRLVRCKRLLDIR
jgi:ankyrin repeat protein